MDTTKGKQRDLKGSRNVLPSREVLTESHNENEHTVDIQLIGNSHTKETWSQQEELQCTPAEVGIDLDSLEDKDNIFTWFTNPWKTERVKEIIRQVKIGPDLSDEEHKKVQKFFADWADIFALSVSEVKHQRCNTQPRHRPRNNLLHQSQPEASNTTTKEVPL